MKPGGDEDDGRSREDREPGAEGIRVPGMRSAAPKDRASEAALNMIRRSSKDLTNRQMSEAEQEASGRCGRRYGVESGAD